MASFDLSDQDGESLVQEARKIATEFIKTRRKLQLDEKSKAKFAFEAGIFVTLNSKNDLRGCIGFPTPQRLDKALPEAVIAAATQDPRFPPVTPDELDDITFEVTILTPPQERLGDPLQLPQKIKVGRDGLIVRYGHHSGLLLPQVPVEYGWSEREFLEHTCQKAGLPKDSWMEKQAKIFSFEGIIFKEEIPHGKVVRVQL